MQCFVDHFRPFGIFKLFSRVPEIICCSIIAYRWSNHWYHWSKYIGFMSRNKLQISWIERFPTAWWCSPWLRFNKKKLFGVQHYLCYLWCVLWLLDWYICIYPVELLSLIVPSFQKAATYSLHGKTLQLRYFSFQLKQTLISYQ